MKAIGIVGSPRKNGNTSILTAHCLKAIEEEGLEALYEINVTGFPAIVAIAHGKTLFTQPPS